MAEELLMRIIPEDDVFEDVEEFWDKALRSKVEIPLKEPIDNLWIIDDFPEFSWSLQVDLVTVIVQIVLVVYIK